MLCAPFVLCVLLLLLWLGVVWSGRYCWLGVVWPGHRLLVVCFGASMMEFRALVSLWLMPLSLLYAVSSGAFFVLCCRLSLFFRCAGHRALAYLVVCVCACVCLSVCLSA